MKQHVADFRKHCHLLTKMTVTESLRLSCVKYNCSYMSVFVFFFLLAAVFSLVCLSAAFSVTTFFIWLLYILIMVTT